VRAGGAEHQVDGFGGESSRVLLEQLQLALCEVDPHLGSRRGRLAKIERKVSGETGGENGLVWTSFGRHGEKP
jgi:hypothetical protein